MSDPEPSHRASSPHAASEPPVDASSSSSMAPSAADRVAELRHELSAREDKQAKAIVADVIGRAMARDREQTNSAARELVAAYNIDPSFRPPLFALVDGFERKRSLKNLDRLYDAETKSARSEAERADALLDRAGILLAQGAREEAERLLTEASAGSPERASAWAVIELFARHLGLDAMARAASEARAERARSPELRAVLLHEAAVAEGMAPEKALELLVEASKADPSSARIQTALDGAARGAGRFELVVDALERRAGAERSARPALAAALFVESSALIRSHSSDVARALAASANAVELAPDDPLAWLERAEAGEAAEDYDIIETACARLIELVGGSLGAFAAVLSFRRAEAATASGRAADAQQHLDAARAAAPGSQALKVIASAAPPSLLEPRREALARRLEPSEGGGAPSPDAARPVLHELAAIDAALGDVGAFEARVAAYLELAAPAGAEGGARDGERCRDLILMAVSLGAKLPIEALAPRALAGLERGADAEDPSGPSRSVWRMSVLALAARAGADALARDLAREALDDAACKAWAPEATILFAARVGDDALLARAHTLLGRASSDDLAAAHELAAARALVRAEDLDAARDALTEILAKREDDAYARALLEEVGRARGDVESLLASLRGASAHAAPGVVAAQLSATAHTAEIEGNAELLERSVEEALSHDPSAVDARLLRARIALRAGDASAARSARVGLGAAVWELLAAIDPKTPPAEREATLTRCLEDPSVGVEARFALATSPGISEPARALAAAELGAELVLPADPLEAIRADRPEAWLTLADELRNEDGSGDSADDVATFALRAALLRGELDDDAFLRMAELEDIDGDVRPEPALVSAEVVLDALLRGESSDLSELAALEGRYLEGAGDAAPRDLALAQWRLLVTTGRGDRVLEELLAHAEAHPDDAAMLDALRVAAREARAWREVVFACDALSGLLDESPVGREFAAQLLEEAAAVLMDECDDVEAAEERCRRALELDADREIAYARLHDLLAERGDDPELLDLVLTRAERIDDPERLAPLLYEQARLYRGLGQVDDALATLENLLLLEPEHVGGLALQVEIHVQREEFAEAVEALQALAGAPSAPASQRRIARLGAAEFLEKKLGDTEAAIAELAAIERELGMVDEAVRQRIATLSAKGAPAAEAPASAVDAALEPLALAPVELAVDAEVDTEVEPTEGPAERAAALREVGERARIEGRLEDAALAFSQALDAKPDDVEAAEALAEIPAASDVQERIEAASRALRAGAFPISKEHLDRLLRIARLAGDWGLVLATQRLSSVLAGGSVDAPDLVVSRLRAFDESKLKIAEGIDSAPMLELARLVDLVLREAEPSDPSALGAHSKDARPRGGGDSAAELVHALTAQFGAQGDVYVVGEGKTFASGLTSSRPFYVLGGALRNPLAVSYDAAFSAAGFRVELPMLAARAARGGAPSVALAIHAACTAGGVLVPGADTTGGFTELARALSKTAHRHSARFTQLAGPLRSSSIVLDWAHALLADLTRTAVLASGDLGRGLGVLSGASGRVPTLTEGGQAIRLARAWLSDEAIAARAHFGWRKPER